MPGPGLFLAEATAGWKPPWDGTPGLAVVAGSGLGSGLLAAAAVEVPYSEIPGFPEPSVPGHPGAVGWLPESAGGVLLFAGRFHLYEGVEPQETAAPVALAAALGAPRLVQLSAVGGIHPEMSRGTWVGVVDHIGLTGRSPLEGATAAGADPFIPGRFHSTPARLAARRAATDLDLAWREGIYGQAPGPQLETPAEIEAMRRLGADVVGMSTVPEAVAAGYLGLEHLAMGLVTNTAPMEAGEGHDDVLALADGARRALPGFLEALAGHWYGHGG